MTVRKFKVGDVVRVTSTDYIHQYDTSINIGDIGVIHRSLPIDDNNYSNNHYVETPYRVLDWWFPEDDLELVADKSKSPIKSDGGSSSYYAKKIPPNARRL